VDPVPATTTSSPPTHNQFEQYPKNDSGTYEFKGYDIEENNLDPGPGGKQSEQDPKMIQERMRSRVTISKKRISTQALVVNSWNDLCLKGKNVAKQPLKARPRRSTHWLRVLWQLHDNSHFSSNQTTTLRDICAF
jgi:hypothetical protein